MTDQPYSRELLRAAVGLADFPLAGRFDVLVDRPTPVCGSRITLGLDVAADGRVTRVGIGPHLCAFGQASAALFARHAIGLRMVDLDTARDALARWLDDETMPPPNWPEIATLAAVRSYPARHAAVLLAFEAGAEAARRATNRSAAA